ncbi:uncharacterized protein RSE6_14633 [Rhynchosporium secalis]|uniref:DUF1868 domain-containing protein n=1 Tax=Rhynchosporium secalis TaxID=38038 RepID=A0A1E1MVR4_RHYSE|nr:uncharacterized protein RSE6_14633 [Rhynchosporium secalis]
MTSTTATSEPVLAPQRRLYPIGVPSKFSPEGIVQRYPGNTTVCHIPSTSPLIPGQKNTYERLRSHPTLSSRIHLLPPESWHMTIFDGVRETECEPGMWPEGKEKQPLSETTAIFAERLKELDLEKEGLGPPYRMRVRSFDGCIVGVGLEIEGATVEEEKRMRRLRDRLADTLGFRAPNHEIYQFHISIAYLLRHIDGADRKDFENVIAELLSGLQHEFELGPVEFCTFENMHAYPRLFYLGEQED